MPNRCRICSSFNTSSTEDFAEQMFRTGESFGYFSCRDCGCWQIAEIPPSMECFYPNDYYSYDDASSNPIGRVKRGIRTFLAYRGPKSLFEGREWWEHGDVQSIRRADIAPNASILDLGCGSGVLLSQLKDIGFRNLLGADPYIDQDMRTPNGVPIRRSDGSDLGRQFDLVMMHHSLEHVWDQHSTVRLISDILRPGGKCIIRIPTIDCWAWQHYGGNWIQLDPPRHFYLHSRRSIARLLEATALSVTEIIDDSTSYQILGSEKISTGAPLIDPVSKRADFAAHLPPDTISGAYSRARELNLQHRGDSIAVHACKPG